MSMIDNTVSTPKARKATPLDKDAYERLVEDAALAAPWDVSGIAKRLKQDKGATSDQDGQVCALLNRLRLPPERRRLLLGEVEWLLMYVMSAVNFAANRHKVKAHLSDTASLCKEQATTLEAVLAKLANQPGVIVLPSEHEAVAKLAASLRYQGEKREADQARLSQKLDTPSAVVMTAARKIHHYVGEGCLPKLKATEIAVLLSGALGCDVAPATVREALRGCGDFPSTKRPKSRAFEKA